MVCQACRSVETVDIGVGDQYLETVDEGVGDNSIMVRKVDVGVGDGFIDPIWLSTEIFREKKGSETEERAASIQEKEIRNKSRKQRKPRKICNLPKKQSKPLKIKFKGSELTSSSKSAAVAKAKLNSPDEIDETSSGKSRFRVCKSKNLSEKFKIPTTETAFSTGKSGKSRSTPVKTSKCSSTSDECGTTGESSADDCGASDNSTSGSDHESTEVHQVKRKKRIRIFKLAQCNICGRSYKTNYLKRHMKTHEEDDDKKKPHPCKKCGKRFTDYHYRNNHQTICGQDSQSLFQCRICEKSLCSKSSLELHVESHSNERSFQCHLCAKLFKSYNTLYNHIKTHSELQPFACDQCERRFKEKRSLVYHKERYHEGKVERFKCELCEKVFNHRNGLAVHMDRHRGIKKYTCEVCGKRFGRHNHWRIHLRIHSDTKTYTCTECGKGFNQKYDLKRHMSTHTGIKPFKCDECGKQFIHRVYLVRHQCSVTKESSNNNHLREVASNRDENNEMLNNNLVPIVEYGNNMMASGEIYNLNMF